MRCYVDSSAMYALVDIEDARHELAHEWLRSLPARTNANFVTSSHAVVETIALLQRRIGFEAVTHLLRAVLPSILVVQLDDFAFSQCLTALAVDGRRQVSLVDHIGFHTARAERCDAVFAFDQHFADAGFTLVPATVS